MMKKLLLILLLPLSTMAANSNTAKIEELELRLGDLEINQALSKFRFSGTFTNQLEYYSKAARGDGSLPNQRSDTTDAQLFPMMMRLELNVDVDISRSLKFYSTIAMAKFMNLSNRNKRNERDSGAFMSFAGSNNMKDSTGHFDMAYVSYNKPGKPWTLAAGRMPTNNGPPMNQLDGVGRTGTYPSLSFNNILDGVAYIYSLDKYMPRDHSLKFRIFYTPFIQIDADDKTTQTVDSTGSTTDGKTGESGEKVDSHGALTTLLVEYNLKNLSWARGLDIFYSTYHVDKFYSETNQKLQEGSIGVPMFENDGIDYFDVSSHTVYFGINNFLNSRFTSSFTYSHYIIKFAGEEYRSDNILLTTNYKFDNNLNAKDIVGVEYLKTDKNRAPTEETTFFVNDFYNMMNGEGSHLYYTRIIDANQVVRIGWFNYYTKGSIYLLDDAETNESSTYVRWKVFF